MSATLGFLSQLSSAGLEKVDLNKASEKRRGGRRTAEVEIVALEMVGHVGGAGHGGGSLYIYYIYEIPPSPACLICSSFSFSVLYSFLQ